MPSASVAARWMSTSWIDPNWDKSQLRQAAKARLSSLDLTTLSHRAVSHLLSFRPLWENENLLAYSALNFELDLSPIYIRWQKEGKNLFLPNWGKEIMHFAPVQDWDSLPTRTVMGQSLKVPPQNSEPFQSAPGVLLVPARMMDKNGHRLGQGAGHFDRFLVHHPQLITIGVCPKSMVIPSLPHEPHDIPLHYLAHEDGVEKVFA